MKIKGIKTHVEGRSDINNMHIIEVQVFGSEVGNIALGKPVRSSGSDQSVSSSSGAVEAKINDGDRTTYWDAGKYAQQPWIIVDLQGLYKLDELKVVTYWMRTDNRYYHYDLYASTDGENFTKIASKDWNTPETIFGENFDLSGQEICATHIKLVGLYDSANSSFHLNELRVYGTEVEPEPEIVAEGVSGTTTWKLASNGVLTVSPAQSGAAMKNYCKVKGVLTLPWTPYAEQITKVVIEEGVTTIGQMAFYKLPNLAEVVLPASLAEIRSYAFRECTALSAIDLGAVKTIRQGAFYGCTALEDVAFAEGAVIEDWAFYRTTVLLP